MQPVSLHRFLYGNDNPVNNTDPSGEISLTSVAAATVVLGTISLIVFPNFRALLLGLHDRFSLTIYTSSNIKAQPSEHVVADIKFARSLNAISEHARNENVKLLVTHSFREAGRTLTGAIVTPSKDSNHFVGHAIDMNVLYGPNYSLSCTFKNGCLPKMLTSPNSVPSRVRNFIQAIRNDSQLFWGGDLPEIDVVHIDDRLNRRDPEEWKKRFEATQSARVPRTYYRGP